MDTKKIGMFLKDLRNEKGMTQEQLGEKLVLVIKQFLDGKPENICHLLIVLICLVISIT